MKHDENGWSLLDLLVSLGVIAILALGATWSMSSVTRINQLTRISADFLSMLDTSAQMAVSLGIDISLTFRPGETTVSIRSGTSENSDLAQLQKAYSFPEGITLERATFGDIESDSTVLILRASGSATPGTIILHDSKGRRCQITQALRGQRSLKCFK